ncbi:MAG: MBL fold metallo-hydrolase [Peptoniphilus sp.]|nr:MBL fold metallo-hydrolase [Peptoniphilus sp.]MDD7363491.1 MBL fold metallo-hydrolase [Bacillota bacterium]MDY6044805.1 MBL fold metallo-hydrolase [Peptoniphilus sp.]
MKFCALASGSTGNCQYIETNEKRILVDAGLSGKAIERNLAEIGVDPSTLDAIFVTHEHNDHVKGVGILARRYGLEVFANQNTWTAMSRTVKHIDDHKRNVYRSAEAFHFGDIDVYPMPLFHDAAEACGYVFASGGKKVSILTDTGWVNTSMLENMAGSDIYYVESNHDLAMLRNGPYPRVLKERIASTQGHLSNDHCAELLTSLVQKKQEHIVLAHLSQENNIPLLAARSTRETLAEHHIHEGIDFMIEVAKPKEPTKLIEL